MIAVDFSQYKEFWKVDSQAFEASEGNDDSKRLAKDSPFVTTLKLCTGPMLSTIALSFQEAIELFFIKQGYGATGITIISILSFIRNAAITFSNFFQQASVVKFSELVTNEKKDEANKLFVDIARIMTVFGIIFSFALSFAIPTILVEMGLPKDYTNTALGYMIPVLISIPFDMLFQLETAALMALGKATTVAIIQILSLVVSLVAESLFIFAFKTPMWALGITFVLGNITASIALLVYFFCGKETISFQVKYILKCVSPEFFQMLKLSVPGIIQIMAIITSPIIIATLLSHSAEGTAEGSLISTVYSVSYKPYQILVSTVVGAMSGLLPAATYALQKKDISRMRKLTISAMFLPYVVILVFWPLMVFKPDPIMDIWLDDADLKELVPSITPKIFYAIVLEPISTLFCSLLVILGRYWLATSVYVVELVVLITVSLIYFFTNSSDPTQILYSYVFSDSVNCIYASILMFICLKQMNSPSYNTSLLSNDALLLIHQ